MSIFVEKNFGLKIAISLVVCAALCLSNTANAQVYFGGQDLSTGNAVRTSGTTNNGRNVEAWDSYGNPIKIRDSVVGSGSSAYRWVSNNPAGEEPSLFGNPSTNNRNGVRDTTGSGYADMHRTTRNTEEADRTYVQPGYLNGRYQGVIDFGVTRDANWITVYTVADVTVSGVGSGGTLPGIDPGHGNNNWGSAARQQGISNFLKGFSSADGYIDNFVVQGAAGTVLGNGVFASSAELYGTADMAKEGGHFDQLLARGYDAGTNYRQGGLQYMDKNGAGVIGQSGGYYFDEAGQYTVDANGNVTFNNNARRDEVRAELRSYQTSGTNNAAGQNPTFTAKGTAAQRVAYDDWNQHGLVGTGLDLIAYTTSFDAGALAAHNATADAFNQLDAVIYGNFSVMGNFLDIYINGNKVGMDMFTLFDEYTYGTQVARSEGSGNLGQGIFGDYAFMLDLAMLDSSWWNADGVNDISFMVETVSPWALGLGGNETYWYSQEHGFNYFSAGIGFGYNGNEVPEPATLAILGLGLAGLGLAVRRRKK